MSSPWIPLEIYLDQTAKLNIRKAWSLCTAIYQALRSAPCLQDKAQTLWQGTRGAPSLPMSLPHFLSLPSNHLRNACSSPNTSVLPLTLTHAAPRHLIHLVDSAPTSLGNHPWVGPSKLSLPFWLVPSYLVFDIPSSLFLKGWSHLFTVYLSFPVV